MDDYTHEKYFSNILFLTCLLIMGLHVMKKNDEIIRAYLKRLEHNWKQVIDDLQEGIILISKDFKILYQNNAVQTIFGLKN